MTAMNRFRLDPRSQFRAVKLFIQENNRDKTIDRFSLLEFPPRFSSIGRTDRPRVHGYKFVSRRSLAPDPCNDELFGDFHDIPTPVATFFTRGDPNGDGGCRGSR